MMISISRRSEFMQKVTELLKKHRSEGTMYLFSVDFAEFKLINYIYGFAQGDALLQNVVDFVRKIPGCICCERVASDQFIFLVIAKTPQSDREIIASYHEWSDAFLRKYQDNYPACKLKFWCGIYQIEDGDVVSAIENANLARIKARESEADTAVLFKNSLLEELVQERQREADIMCAVKKGKFSFYLQPQVDLTSGEIIGAEALARGIGENGEVIYPDAFVSVLENNHGIIDLDHLILERVCQNMRQRLDCGKPVVRTSVNLSRQHIWYTDSARILDNIVKRYQIPPKLIMFELTENILITEFSGAKLLGDSLRELGYATSIDDFGSGYAGIDVWRRLSFDELKLDKKFMDDDPERKKRDEIIARGLIWIANKMNTVVICEGVESSEQCRDLLNMNCQYAQGYFFSKPVPPNDFYENYTSLNGHYPMSFLNA